MRSDHCITQDHIFYLARKLSLNIPNNISNSFLKKQELALNYFYQKERYRIDKKIEGLINKQKNDFITNIKNIKYFSHTQTNINNIKQFSFSPPPVVITNKDVLEINLDSLNHLKTNKQFSPLESINKKWFVNLTHNNIPHSVQCLL